jgi:MYXO-CTERM domain-containing protein
MRAERALLVALAFGLASFVTSRADAFCRTTTVPVPPNFDPTVQGSCFDQGVPLFQRSACFPYRLLTKDSPIVPNAILSDRLRRAFATWTAPNATCTPGITGIELAPSPSTQIVGYSGGQANQNLVGVATDWRYGDGEDLTFATLTFNQATGEILGADLELNPTVSWSWEDTPLVDKVDLQSALTHEIGHILGVAHSEVDGSAMSGRYDPGSIGPRKLGPDDVAAVCAVYSPVGALHLGVTRTGCELTPGTPEESCSNPEISHGCSTTSNASGTGALGGGLLLGVAAILVRRRRAE